jgi:hypothetical protein
VYTVTLSPTANILHVKSKKALENFARNFFLDSPYYPSIDWNKVAEEYQGIIIAPYRWEHRLDMMWYYGWDCASGCIWDSKAIERVEYRFSLDCVPVV